MVNELFAGSIRNIEAALDVRALRQNLIAANVANAGTPGYRALDVDFDKTMANVIDAMEGPLGGEPLRPSEALRGALEITGADAFTVGNANNTVSVEEQMGRLEENGLMYQITTQLASAKFQVLKRAIDEGGRNS